jgi:hypothetical protein
MLTTEKVFARYGDKLADLSELLDYGIKNPNTQEVIAIVWKDGKQFWFANLCNRGSQRGIDIRRDRSDDMWGSDSRFLLRK